MYLFKSNALGQFEQDRGMKTTNRVFEIHSIVSEKKEFKVDCTLPENR